MITCLARTKTVSLQNFVGFTIITNLNKLSKSPHAQRVNQAFCQINSPRTGPSHLVITLLVVNAHGLILAMGMRKIPGGMRLELNIIKCHNTKIGKPDLLKKA